MNLMFQLSLLLALLLAFPPLLPADAHVVSSADLHSEVLAATGKREADVARVHKFFSSEPASKALKSAGMDPSEVRQAAATLSDEELSRLASRALAFEKDFAAGALTNQQLTYIVIALGTAVLILVIVAA